MRLAITPLGCLPSSELSRKPLVERLSAASALNPGSFISFVSWLLLG
jgi:hypothetical protein